MAGYTKTYTLDFTSTGDTVYTAVDKLEDNIDSLVTWVNDLKKSYASTTAPVSPALDEGQIWYESDTEILWVYDGTNSHAVNVIVATADPTGEREGDLWYESDTEILRVSDGTNWHIVNIAVATSAPSTPTPQEGDVYFNSTTHLLYHYDGTNWRTVGYSLADNSDTSSSGTGEDNLTSMTVAANTMGATGGYRFTVAGTKTGANGNKTIKFYFGTVAITLNAAANDENDWRGEILVFNTAAGAQRITWLGWNSTTIVQGYDVGTEDTTAAVTVKCTGECAHADDVITQTMLVAEKIL